MSELTWQTIVDEMQADGWAVDWEFVNEAGSALWRAEAMHPATGEEYERRDLSLHVALLDLRTVTRGRSPVGA